MIWVELALSWYYKSDLALYWYLEELFAFSEFLYLLLIPVPLYSQT